MSNQLFASLVFAKKVFFYKLFYFWKGRFLSKYPSIEPSLRKFTFLYANEL